MFPAEEIPDTIGTYRIVRRLAPIGPAEVYLARNEGPLGYARECELKLLPDTSDGSGELAEELAREAAICAKLNHPAVVRVFDFFEHRGKLVLALEHVEGASLGDLATWLSEHRKKLGDTAAYYIGSRIAGAIADAHAAVDEHGKSTPIVHRNLTPDNVLVAVDGEVRLTGFGVGKILGRTPDTAIGRIKGTPGFMAPEQARGEPVTTKADVYGLGLLMWSLLAGKRPPTDGTWPRRISGIRTDLPREVAAVVDAALDHFPGTRKISAREIDQWLSKAAPAAKGKAELRDHLAAMRGDSVAKDEPPPPSRRMPAPANPFQGVRFGPPPEGGAAPRAARRSPDAARQGEPQRTSTGTALSRVVLALPPPPPPEPPAAPPAPRFGPPPPATTPAAPPVAAPRFGPPPEEEELSLEPDEEIVAMDPEPAASHSPRGGPVVPKPSILPTAASTLAAVAALPRSSLLGVGGVPGADIAPAEEIAPARPAEATPHPAPPPAERVRKPGFALGTTIVVSAITSVVVVVALYVVGRRDGAPRPAASATASATTTAAPVTPPPATTATVAAAPSASATAIAVNPTDLPYGFGYLTVATPASANVYLSGKIVGPANAPLRVRCGRWFVRLAAPPESRYPEWVSPGETVVVACQQVTRVDMSAP